MLMPSIFGENLFDDWFDDDFFGRHSPLYGKHAKNMMKTDIRETKDSYELDIDLPGFKKEDVQIKLENGYLTIAAVKNLEREKKEQHGRYIRQERYTGNCSRSFYVGSGLAQNEIRATFKHGILKLSVPKKDNKAVEQKNYITIE